MTVSTMSRVPGAEKAVSCLDLHPRIHLALKKGSHKLLLNYTTQSLLVIPPPLTFSSILSLLSCLPHIPAGLHHLSSILVYSSGDLVRRTGLSHPDVFTLLRVASRTLLPTFFPITALQMYQREAQGYYQGRCHKCYEAKIEENEKAGSHHNEGWSSSSCCGSVAEHWQFKPEVSWV